jgi:hypothetical protein
MVEAMAEATAKLTAKVGAKASAELWPTPPLRQRTRGRLRQKLITGSVVVIDDDNSDNGNRLMADY